MWRFLGCFLVVALLGVGLIASEDRKEKREPDKARSDESRTSKSGKPVPFFDVDEFIKDYDKNKDGFLSKDELPERFRHVFDKLDTNKDGKLSREELQKGFTLLQPQRRPSDFVFILVEMSDCDECCAEELQKVYDFLRKLDKNNNGKIDATELKEARENMINERVDGILKALDTNKDGKISREEARGQIKRHFDDLDTNKDGFISRDELLKAAQEKPTELPRKPVKEGEKREK
jgi:Ca2+-binding EF-hand superfamily protein